MTWPFGTRTWRKIELSLSENICSFERNVRFLDFCQAKAPRVHNRGSKFIRAGKFKHYRLENPIITFRRLAGGVTSGLFYFLFFFFPIQRELVTATDTFMTRSPFLLQRRLCVRVYTEKHRLSRLA